MKKQEAGFLGALLAPLATSLLQAVIFSVVKDLVLLHPLSNIKIIHYFNYELRFNGVFSRNNLPRMKNGAYAINLDDKNSKRTYWVSLFVDKNIAAYFDSFGMEYILQEVLNKTKDKSITHSLFRTQGSESIMCGFYCIAFIEYMLVGKNFLDNNYLFLE